MSANNYILIKEDQKHTYKVSENNYEPDLEIQAIGIFDSLRSAIEKAEEYISNPDIDVEYGIRFSLKKTEELKVSKEKDFDKWNKIKKEMHSNITPPLFSEREIWWCSLGLNIGSEEDGKGSDYLRPVLVIRKFNKNIFYGLPITSKIKDDKFHIAINSGDIHGSIILSQMRLIDAKRLSYLMGKITDNDVKEAKKKLKVLFP